MGIYLIPGFLLGILLWGFLYFYEKFFQKNTTENEDYSLGYMIADSFLKKEL